MWLLVSDWLATFGLYEYSSASDILESKWSCSNGFAKTETVLRQIHKTPHANAFQKRTFLEKQGNVIQVSWTGKSHSYLVKRRFKTAYKNPLAAHSNHQCR